ncbi:baculoviral IAP repeat-containing protein 7-like isoform X2 [Phymastichus coffea]|uniref:baculoviral IAP repeat-containing protein 7-like isoform X2 n=1 Tax=Phymastichus coffea TaxID=108790 RepID=UPI00273B6AA2|nr:baculoviral IAP repeat-containing protein 7-like isoform X2 [Phymastichus coffea]
MNSEECRLQTFQEWPSNTPVSPERLAKAGFYYTGQAQVVQCFICATTLTEWNYGDQAMARHRLANPECPFVLDPAATCNIPIINSNGTAALPNSSDNNSNRSIAQSADMKMYSNRLSSFHNWPISNIISPERLARSGFYYLQLADMVECVYCQGVILKWEPGDDPDREHRIHFPNCDFHLRQETDEEKVEFGNVKLMPGTTSSFAELGIQHHSAPRQPKHATYDGRLRTFQGWPSNIRQTPEMLADAGFYYVGSEDQVRCFHCDGGLRNWEETDEAWTEHAKWFPKCGYVNLIKGQDFVTQCTKIRPPIDQSILDGVPSSGVDNSLTPPVTPANSPPQRQARRLTDAELEGLLGTPPAVAALEIGLHVGRVKMALKRRMEQTGLPYTNADQLIEDATLIQLREEDNINMTSRQTPDSPSAELTHLLNQIITTAEAASSSSTPTEIMLNSERNNPPVRRRRRPTPSEDEKDEKTASLEDENRRLREARQCKICMDREVAVVFLPCGHLSTCVFCAPSLTHCPMCRHDIRATVRTFLA